MRLDVYHHFGESNILEALLEKMEAILEKVNINTHKLNKIEMTTQEAVEKITAQRAQLAKIKGEIEALKALVNTTPNVPQEIVDAINGSGQDIQALDDLNDDAPVIEPPAEGTGG